MDRVTLRQEEDARFWRALPWAVLAWGLIFFLVGHFFLRSPKVEEMPPTTVDARIVELPDTPSVQAPLPQPQPLPKQKLPEPAPVSVKQALDSTPPPPSSKPQMQAPAASPPPPAAVTAPAPGNSAFGTENHGILATYKPDPVLPDDLMGQVNGMAVTARFHVNADGSFAVELVQKAMDPRLKRAILDVLKTWKFNPAVQGGKPVAATQDFSFSF